MLESDKVENKMDSEKEAQEKTEKDFYTILDVPKTATEKQIGDAYKSLALQYHPDKNPNDPQAEAKFQEIKEAYEVLSDPNKRRQYDLNGTKAAGNDYESVDVSALGGIQRVFGAMISRLGVPIPTQIAPDVISIAETICRDGGLEGGGPPLDPRVNDLAWGWEVDGKVERQAAVFYRLTVDTRQEENGFVVLCKSLSRGKFKLIMFDSAGAVLYQEESMKVRQTTQAALYFTNFDVYRLGEPSLATLQDKETPPVFTKLETFSSCKKTISSGQYLLCVYGDNFLGRTNFNIAAIPSKNDASSVTAMEEVDEALIECKGKFGTLRTEYEQTKKAFEEALEKVKNESENLETLLAKREKSYAEFLEESLQVFRPTAPEEKASGAIDTPPVSDVEQKTDANSTTAAFGQYATTAAKNATAATGWLARRLSVGLRQVTTRGETASENGSTFADAGDGSAYSDSMSEPIDPDLKPTETTGTAGEEKAPEPVSTVEPTSEPASTTETSNAEVSSTNEGVKEGSAESSG